MVYELRPEAVWSDGEPITVDDFRYTWFHQSGRDDQCTGCNPKFTVGWEDVASVEGSDEGRTVTITLAGRQDERRVVRAVRAVAVPGAPRRGRGVRLEHPEGMGKSSEHFRDTVPTWSGGAVPHRQRGRPASGS